MTLGEIENLCKRYATKRRFLTDRITALNTDMERVRRVHYPGIKDAATEAAEQRTALLDAVKAAPHLFEKPKTLTLHGIKVGWQKQADKIEWDSDKEVCERIRKELPADQAAVLINEPAPKPVKTALGKLADAVLKRLGVRRLHGVDVALVSESDGEVDKMVEAMLKEPA